MWCNTLRSTIIVTGLDEYISCAITFAVCTFYTTIVIFILFKTKQRELFLNKFNCMQIILDFNIFIIDRVE